MANPNKFLMGPNCCEDAKEYAPKIDCAVLTAPTYILWGDGVKPFRFCPYCGKPLEKGNVEQI